MAAASVSRSPVLSVPAAIACQSLSQTRQCPLFPGLSHQALRCFRKKRPTSVLSLCLITGTQYTHCFPLPGRPALLPGIFCSTVIYHSASQTKCSLVCSFLPLFGAPPSSAHGSLGHPPPLHMASWGTSTPAYDLLGAPHPCIWPTWGTPTPVNDLLGAPPIHLHGLLGAPPPHTHHGL